jgi:hypothetical protein
MTLDLGGKVAIVTGGAAMESVRRLHESWQNAALPFASLT